MLVRGGGFHVPPVIGQVGDEFGALFHGLAHEVREDRFIADIDSDPNFTTGKNRISIPCGKPSQAIEDFDKPAKDSRPRNNLSKGYEVLFVVFPFYPTFRI